VASGPGRCAGVSDLEGAGVVEGADDGQGLGPVRTSDAIRADVVVPTASIAASTSVDRLLRRRQRLPQI